MTKNASPRPASFGSAPVVGIDLGTTSVRVAVWTENGPVIIRNTEGSGTTPSYVSRETSGWTVGEHALRAALQTPDSVAFSAKRLIGRKVDDRAVKALKRLLPYEIVAGENNEAMIRLDGSPYTPTQISALLLKKMKETAEAYIGETVTQSVITVPAYFDETQRRATRDAARIAGFDVVRLETEPTMAALNYSLGRKVNEKIVVFDLGGGTLDVSIVQIEKAVFEVKATHGDMMLGGEDFDFAIIEYLAAEFQASEGVNVLADPAARNRLKHAAEQAKIDLTQTAEARINLPFLATARGKPIHMDVTLSRSRLNGIIEPLVKRATKLVDVALKDAGLSRASIDTVVLVGGSTRMPAVRNRLSEMFGEHKLFGALRREDAVALGAAIKAGALQGVITDFVLMDVNPLSVGLETLGGVFTRVIDRNTTVPTRQTHVFSTAEDNQNAVTINIHQGENEMAADNKLLGQFHLYNIPPAPKGMPQIEVTFDLDADGLLTISAMEKQTGEKQDVTISQTGSISDEDSERIRAELEKFDLDTETPSQAIDLAATPKAPARELPIEVAPSAVSIEVATEEDTPATKPRVFFSYAREDEAWVSRVKTAFAILERRGLVEVYWDRSIQTGEKWEEKLFDYIARANVSVLFLSNDFLASNYIFTTELPALFAEHERRQLTLFPLVVRPCPFSLHPEIEQFQAFNDPRSPLSALAENDLEEELVRLVLEIAKAV